MFSKLSHYARAAISIIPFIFLLLFLSQISDAFASNQPDWFSYSRDHQFEKIISKRYNKCMPKPVRPDRSIYIFRLVNNLKNKCVNEQLSEKNAIKYGGLLLTSVSSPVAAPVLAAYAGEEMATQAIQCIGHALVDSSIYITDNEKARHKEKISNLLTVKDWIDFASNLTGIASADKSKSFKAKAEATAAVFERAQESHDVTEFIMKQSQAIRVYLGEDKSKIYFENAEQAANECRFKDVERYLDKAEETAKSECAEYGNRYRLREANLRTYISIPIVRRSLRSLPALSPTRSVTYDKYNALKRDLEIQKNILGKFSKKFAKIEEKRSQSRKRSGVLDRLKPKINASIETAHRALEKKDYALACRAMDNQQSRKILEGLSKECRIRFRDDGADPYKLIKYLGNEINFHSFKLRNQIITLVNDAVKDINSCLLSKLNSAQAKLNLADALAAKLLVADDNGCKKQVPRDVSLKLSEGYRILEDQKNKCLVKFPEPDLAYFLVTVAGQGFTYKYDYSAREPVTDAAGNVTPDEHGITWLSIGAWVGIQVKGEGQSWIQVKKGEDHDTTKENLRKYLLSRACQKPWLKSDQYQHTRTSASQPTIWQKGPLITTFEGPFKSKYEYTGKRKSNWRVTMERKADGTPIFMNELFRKVKPLADCGGKCCALACTDEFHCE